MDLTLNILRVVGMVLCVLLIMWYVQREYNKPDVQARVNKARYEEAHRYGPCNSEPDRLSKYMSDVEFVRRQEDIHDNCEGHAICDLVSSIEHDYRQQKETSGN